MLNIYRSITYNTQEMVKRLNKFLWLAISLLAVGWLLKGINKEELLNAIRQARIGWLVTAIVLFGISQAALSRRWMALLKPHQVVISFWQAVKLTFLGLFYNNFMPGSVGGDLLKGWYVTHHCPKERKLHAALSVLIDRLLGLSGTVLLGSCAATLITQKFTLPIFGYNLNVKILIFAILAAMITGLLLTLSKRARKMLAISAILKKLPFQKKLQEIESGFRIYKHHPESLILALVITVTIQTLAITSIWLLTVSLNLKGVTLLHCISVMPIIWVISASIPVPGGLGIMEYLFIPFFVAVADSSAFNSPEELKARVVALSLLNRFMIYVVSAPGGLVPLFGGHLPKQAEMAAEFEQIEDEIVDTAPEKLEDQK